MATRSNLKNKKRKRSSKKELELKKTKKIYKQGYARRTLGQKFADGASDILGSWGYIVFQTFFVAIWIALNLTGFFYRWDGYPFIFLNLTLSVMAAYTAPVILMSQNRQADRDRKRAIIDLATDKSSERKIKDVQQTLVKLEKKLDKVIENSNNSR